MLRPEILKVRLGCQQRLSFRGRPEVEVYSIPGALGNGQRETAHPFTSFQILMEPSDHEFRKGFIS